MIPIGLTEVHLANWKLRSTSDCVSLALCSAHQQCADLVLKAVGLFGFSDLQTIWRHTFAAFDFEME